MSRIHRWAVIGLLIVEIPVGIHIIQTWIDGSKQACIQLSQSGPNGSQQLSYCPPAAPTAGGGSAVADSAGSSRSST